MIENLKNKAVENKDKHATLRKEGLHLLVKIAIAGVVGFMIFTFIFGGYKVKDYMMDPYISYGDFVLYYRMENDLHVGDVVTLQKEDEKQVRRIVAGAGDTVDITEEGLHINGALQFEPNITHHTLPYEKGIRFPITLKEDEWFVLADNRQDALDSRVYGVVKTKEIEGKVITLVRRNMI